MAVVYRIYSPGLETRISTPSRSDPIDYFLCAASHDQAATVMLKKPGRSPTQIAYDEF
jgi:hypothetical protein